ncbi:MAG: shikimate dehydrogenase [Alphaproteobacteria bacterium]|jgi:shikimate dehydrogenase|nr:shikimate dehydrogenase [Alphaproteobacteria bacterium]
MIRSAEAAIAGVMGWPVGHSLSPRLHEHWLQRYGLDGAYVPMAVAPERLAEALVGLWALGFRGCNITVPHKEAALALVDDADDAARAIGAVNTVVATPDGRLVGLNTDGFGFLENLRAGAPGWDPASGPALVLGAGGAARAVLKALADCGVPELRLVNRTAGRAEKTASELGPAIRPVDWAEREAALEDCALLVNTTTLGMTGQPPLPLDLAGLPPPAVVTDLVYAPLRTPLLQAAAARGNPTVDGLGMLLHQARPGFAAWFGIEPMVDEALRAAVLAG